MFQIDIKPISINQPYCPKYRETLLKNFKKLDLPKVDPDKPLFLFLEFGIGKRMDASNGIKRFEDCLTEYLKINDKRVIGIYTRKVIKKKGHEHIRFNIFPFEYDLIEYLKREI